MPQCSQEEHEVRRKKMSRYTILCLARPSFYFKVINIICVWGRANPNFIKNFRSTIGIVVEYKAFES
ncbi:transmembrane protein, putative [Medicago truncatula]|uniref:Transmembrane protein, putative n=1 Tax=Medicago truncatula TaxID=3880 RepID=A0A072TPD1_MEDTR|nr:transmembrane protein, putative [Medicago truncatula]